MDVGGNFPNVCLVEAVALLILTGFGVFYIFGGFHAIYDGWKPWKHGIRWWKFKL